MQKYPHIIESYGYILKMFVVIFLLSENFLTSFEICLTPKLLKYVALLDAFTLSAFIDITIQ